jgi:transposase-like protein
LPTELGIAYAASLVSATQVPARGHPGGVFLYFRFTLSLGDVEEMLAERGIDASYETVHR